jgi:hypothetical protein
VGSLMERLAASASTDVKVSLKRNMNTHFLSNYLEFSGHWREKYLVSLVSGLNK